jgi:carboxylesterase type B
MGVLGYLAAKALANSSYPYLPGNYGLLDAVEALRWVKTNIVHFAGDPESITVLGHRAGATMLTAIAASHKAEVGLGKCLKLIMICIEYCCIRHKAF